MIEQTTYVLNAGVPPIGEVAPIYGSPLVISNPLQPATEIPTLTLVSLGGLTQTSSPYGPAMDA